MSMTTYRNVRTYKPSSSRYVGIGFVVALHVVLVIFLIQVLGVRTFEAPPPPVKVSNIDIPKAEEKLPPPPPPDFKPPPQVFVPPPDVVIRSDAPAPPAAITVTHEAPKAPAPVMAPPAPPAPKVSVPPHVAKALDTERWYPPISKRLNEEGVVTLQMLVAANGAVEDARVAKSSGYPRLDNAAIAMARGGGIPVVPGTQDGKPAEMWLTIAVRFNFSN